MSDDDLCLLCGHEWYWHDDYGCTCCDNGIFDCDCSGFLDPETC